MTDPRAAESASSDANEQIGLDHEWRRDLGIILVMSLAIYLSGMMIGPGWGSDAAYQYAVESGSVDAVPANAWSMPRGALGMPEPTRRIGLPVEAVLRHVLRVIPFVDAPTGVTVISLVASVATLLLLYASIRMVNIGSTAALLSTVSLALSQSFFSHATHPNPQAITLAVLAFALLLTVRALLLGSARDRWPAVLLWILVAVIEPRWLVVVAPPLFVLVRRRADAPRWLWVVAVSAALLWHLFGAFRLYGSLVNLGVVAFQFPLVGWPLLVWGFSSLPHRMPTLHLVAFMLIFGSVTTGGSLREIADQLLPASLGATIYLAHGVEFLRELRRRRFERIFFLTPVLAFSLAILPLATTGAALYVVHSQGGEEQVATFDPHRIELASTSWHNDLWYSVWPFRRGEGASAFITDINAHLPKGAMLIVDPQTRPVMGFVEGIHFPHGATIGGYFAPADSRVFLAGTDPRHYPIEELGKTGDLVPVGPFLEWVPAKRDSE